MPLIFWKKPKKSVGAMSKEERAQFAKELANEALANLTRPIVPKEMFVSQDDLKQIGIQELFNLHSKWSEIYTAERKQLIEKSYFKALDTLQKHKKLNREELIYWKREYYFYQWLDRVIGKPLLNVYEEILNKKSILGREGKWSDALDNDYRDISFGDKKKSGPILLTLDLLINEKSKIYSYEVKIEEKQVFAATDEALLLFLKNLSQGVVSSASDFRVILSI